MAKTKKPKETITPSDDLIFQAIAEGQALIAYSTPFGHAFHQHPASHSTNIRPPVP